MRKLGCPAESSMLEIKHPFEGLTHLFHQCRFEHFIGSVRFFSVRHFIQVPGNLAGLQVHLISPVAKGIQNSRKDTLKSWQAS